MKDMPHRPQIDGEHKEHALEGFRYSQESISGYRLMDVDPWSPFKVFQI